MDINICLFDDFETLDVFGPVEIFGNLKEYCNIKYYSINGGIVTSRHGTKILTETLDLADDKGILFLPGGYGVRQLIIDENFIDKIRSLAENAPYCLTVCTGSAILAKTGLLKNKNATSNKIAFDWVKSLDPEVNWKSSARWVVDGKYYTSSGVSAGMDMSLGFIEDQLGNQKAFEVANFIEYTWNSNKDDDPFAK